MALPASRPDTAQIAANRFGLGVRAGEIESIVSDPRHYVRRQLADPKLALLAHAELPASDVIWRQLRTEEEKLRREREAPPVQNGMSAAPKAGPPFQERIFRTEVTHRLMRYQQTTTPFLERLVSFWSNHFAISIGKGSQVRAMAGAFEREAIRPFVLGRFADMLKAVEQHPVMLLYLDNQQSIGPHSRAANNSGRGLNENLAREILELHTLGVGGGYQQADVTSFAKAITGWTTTDVGNDALYGGRFTFAPNRHEPGDFTILGKTFPEDGHLQGEAILQMLAQHPSTARHIATKLARAFVADDPPKPLIDRLASVFLSSSGDLAAVSSALVDSPESWQAPATKLRSPFEFIIAAQNATQGGFDVGQFLNAMNSLGQPFWQPPGPNGYPDNSSSWAAPEGMSLRLDLATQFARRAKVQVHPTALVEAITGPNTSSQTRQAVARADGREQALAILLMSPEFQRR